MLVRHLDPAEHGLPIAIYCCSNNQAWANDEDIQADIFDHVLAVAPQFDLRIFQSPSGSDFRRHSGCRRGVPKCFPALRGKSYRKRGNLCCFG